MPFFPSLVQFSEPIPVLSLKPIFFLVFLSFENRFSVFSSTTEAVRFLTCFLSTLLAILLEEGNPNALFSFLVLELMVLVGLSWSVADNFACSMLLASVVATRSGVCLGGEEPGM
jgi:hypothetical protein